MLRFLFLKCKLLNIVNYQDTQLIILVLIANIEFSS